MEAQTSLEWQKALLRKKLRQKSVSLSTSEKRQASEQILNQLLRHPRFRLARSILTYLALPSEVETRPIVEEAHKRGKKVYVPRIDSREKEIEIIEISGLNGFKRGPYGILEPLGDFTKRGKPGALDLVVVPGLGFDRRGGRLGRGQGYFDRFLKKAKGAYKIGLAFKCQIVEKVPEGPNDVKVDEVLIG